MPSTAAGWSPALNSQWELPCSTSATRATSWRAPGPSPATTVPRGDPSGATVSPSVSVSRVPPPWARSPNRRQALMPPCPCPAAETYEPCHNPGVPAGGRQSPERRLYPAGATLRFSCAAGRVLLGEGTLRCLPGHPSRWSGSPPICKAGEMIPPHLSTPPPRLGTPLLAADAGFFLPPLSASYDEFYSNRNLDGKGKGLPGESGDAAWHPRVQPMWGAPSVSPPTLAGSCGQGRALGDGAGRHQRRHRRLPAHAGGGPAHRGHLPLLLQVSGRVVTRHPLGSPCPPPPSPVPTPATVSPQAPGKTGPAAAPCRLPPL